ncbi:MAG TPA: glycosyltransferase family 2 protein [Chloroflexota bacterium]|nr:glycosyltransferase family 2 protein [Chloroflexota bacterium]
MLSVVIPIFNEEENVPELHAELQGVLDQLARPHEVIYVDDGSADRSFELLKTLADEHPEVGVIQFRRNFGQTAALAAGMEASRGEVLIFMDGDLQNDPADIPRLLETMEAGDYDVVSGWRKNRQDAALNRKLPSRIANWLISLVSGVHLNDYGCTLKAYRREVIQHFRLYGEMHRFIPAYAAWTGARIAELEVNHRARKYGRSKYGISRTIKVLLDLLTLKFLGSYSTKPIYLFGGIGSLCFLFGGLSFLLVLYMRFFEGVRANRNPVLLIGVFMFLAGLLFITQGLLAEMVTRTYHESQDKPTYVVRRTIEPRATKDERAEQSEDRDDTGESGARPGADQGPDAAGGAAPRAGAEQDGVVIRSPARGARSGG